jgi:hypothetical protein
VSRFTWFLIGVGLGVVAANAYRENPKVVEAFDSSKRAVLGFSEAVAAGYRDRDAELKMEADQAAK